MYIQSECWRKTVTYLGLQGSLRQIRSVKLFGVQIKKNVHPNDLVIFYQQEGSKKEITPHKETLLDPV